MLSSPVAAPAAHSLIEVSWSTPMKIAAAPALAPTTMLLDEND
jgi:hypothetical protein